MSSGTCADAFAAETNSSAPPAITLRFHHVFDIPHPSDVRNPRRFYCDISVRDHKRAINTELTETTENLFLERENSAISVCSVLWLLVSISCRASARTRRRGGPALFQRPLRGSRGRR